ncbi:efflux RND transporter permease subunit [Ponticaulis sp.]|uniref:efflux RND transporter permease subunit n=1 Tax=Ponticaulis sp. TaxID=2020902 RepID=UPI000B686B35|nr:efflux RND transporter permease subunit [Ponticaulis sp.]MAI91981.1 hydrophobe/amphiphile efflux-1 family RND transporter [Ponticaulis sp.]OUX96450.1 MAG: hydrophobe/amphiphile efflux-1 family RND transporter [Hyphomonadaceae bacterium TMED5]|tara:strand:- start:57449 stop:60586 length:3138 start_codon:yes stop_codon:yes gene_type:complete
MARFFIERPVFAWVIAIIIMLAGVMSLQNLPIAQYPEIAPTTININATYPGASAEAVEDSVTQVIEQRMTGLDGLDYISSQSSSAGTSSITLTFEAGTDPDVAQVQVQNKLALATPLLPQAVQRQGVQVNKAAGGFALITSIYSTSDDFDRNDLGDYIQSYMYDQISRIDGVGNTRVFGSQYAMRIWLDPIALARYQLVPSDITAAIQSQNTQVSSGSIGATPAEPGQEITATITLQSLLQTPDDFRELLILTTQEGRSIRLGDVARIELGAETYDAESRFNGYPASGFAVSLATGANALATVEAVKEAVEEMSHSFPEGIEYGFAVDTTPFIETSIHEVQKTLIEAVVLVFIVILVFLQSLRASFVPMIAVPVVLLGTFAVLYTLGFSINVLTMFAMVLAIGLLVDDAIVVVENVERVMEEDHLPPKEATRKSMQQITGALVGIAVVLSAVFIPMAFFPGSAGVIYRQFSVTIVSAMAFSVLVALILSPALCATILKSSHGKSSGWLSRPGEMFNKGFDRFRGGYENVVSRVIRRKWIFMGVFAILLGLIGTSFTRLPTAFLPDEDQGIFFTMIQLPQGSSIERTFEVVEDVAEYYENEEGELIADAFTLAGFNFTGSGQNNGIVFASLKDWSERTGPGQSVADIANRAAMNLSPRTDAMIFAIAPPAIPQLGNSSGFDIYLQDTAGLGHEALLQAQGQLLGMAAQDPLLMGVRPNGLSDAAELNVTIDYQKAQALGISTSDITNLMAVAFGGSYVNDFIDRGRIKRVYVQGEAQYRMQPDDISRWQLRNSAGDMIPLSEIAEISWSYGSPQLTRYNGMSALNLQGSAAPGVSSGDAMNRMEELIGQLPDGISYEWTGISAQERESGNQAALLYAISILFVFLCLAALYESWMVPVAVLLVAPMGVAGAVAGAYFGGLANDVFFQVGLLTTVGLASKNAILIVEFAKLLEERGKGLVEATMEAVRMRFRPILMTSFAFGFGVLPLALSSGAGAAARNAIGTTVLGGIIFATAFGLIFAPLFYVVVRTLTGAKPLVKEQPNEEIA